MNTKIFRSISALFVLLVPSAASAAELTTLHVFYERSFGPIGAVAGFIAIIVLWQLSKNVEETFCFALRMFALIILFINLGSLTFGIHGAGALDGETSRYIERACRLIALLLADYAALVLYLKIHKKGSRKSPANE